MIDLDAIPTGAPDDLDRDETERATEELAEPLADLQERLWAESRQALLVVLQALDAGGKDGTIKKVFTCINPQGVRVTSFKAPTDDELARDFLWRVHAHVPKKGEIGIFNRSHYEDVLVVRVESLVPEAVWRERYGQIRAFEHVLAASGTRLLKLYLHISPEEQRERFATRLAEKPWKYTADDVKVQERWDDYRRAYEDAMNETSTDEAPWHVIPADAKWYRTWLVRSLVVDTLRDMDPQLPTT